MCLEPAKNILKFYFILFCFSSQDSTSQSSQNEETDIEDDRYSQLSDENEEPRSGAVSRSSTPSVVPLKKRRRQAGAEAMMSEAVSYMADMRTRFKETQKEKEVPAKKSENELFGEYVTVKLNKIEDERSRIMIKYKIQSLFYEMQLGLLSQPTSTQPNLYGSMYMANNQLNLLGRMIPTTAPQINIATSNFRENNRQTELHQISSDSEETQNVYTSL